MYRTPHFRTHPHNSDSPVHHIDIESLKSALRRLFQEQGEVSFQDMVDFGKGFNLSIVPTAVIIAGKKGNNRYKLLKYREMGHSIVAGDSHHVPRSNEYFSEYRNLSLADIDNIVGVDAYRSILSETTQSAQDKVDKIMDR